MSWDFIANSTAELAKIGEALFNASKQNVLDEQVQMTRLLVSLARTTYIRCPVKVRHSGNNAVPDFQIESGERRIAVEITKLALPDVEHARGLQQKGLNRTLTISGLYRKQRQPRRKKEVIAEAFVTPALVFPVSIDEHDQIWFAQADESLAAKSAVIARPDFVRGDENWLLLWDRVGTADRQLEARRSAFATRLSGYWKPSWYSRVFLQDHHFFWQLMFTASESVRLTG